jgi:hypothetical protein
MFLREGHFSYTELDAASSGGKDDMVKLRDDAAFSSVSRKKIILLDECHDISRQGQDTLLKQVEQCPEHLVYIFCTTAADQMKPELRDRCMEFQICKVNPPLIAQRLKYICEQEKIPFDESAIINIAEKSGGYVRNAINILEKTALMGDVTDANFKVAARDCDQEIVEMVCNLGIDLTKALDAYKKISSYLPPVELYDRIISLISDGCKVLYGFTDFSPKQLKMVTQLKDTHGSSLLEFLNYLLTRDKYVDRVGLQSDIIILHYKFGAKSFVPSTPSENLSPQINLPTEKSSEESTTAVLSYNDLSKLTVKDRSRVLRELRSGSTVEKKEAVENIPSEWPLPKDSRPGFSSDDVVMTPQEFSQLLVGSRKREPSMGNSGSQ